MRVPGLVQQMWIHGIEQSLHSTGMLEEKEIASTKERLRLNKQGRVKLYLRYHGVALVNN